LTPFPELLLKEAGIKPEQRAEQLSVAEFARLAVIWERINKSKP
jgi:16S rRNA (adenine1518-N6/adenine1519-N6)-dimethyltransferase